MAHANPEFALGLMQRDHAPVRHQLPPPASLSELRRRMVQIGELIAIDYPVDPVEREAYRIWQATVRQQRAVQARARQVRDALAEPVGGMHGGDPTGLRFVEPVRRGHGSTKRWATR